MKRRSLLKCFFRSYYRTNTPVVVQVRFFVSPPSVKVSSKLLKAEATPVLHYYEICDYLISFLEMLYHVLINSYRQIVKIDAKKHYSDNPRIIFKFMKWNHYVQLQSLNAVHTKAKTVNPLGQKLSLQSFSTGNETDQGT